VSGVEQLLKALSDCEVKFIVVGAYAAIAQGSTLRTDDLDICYERTARNYKRITRALAHFKPRLRDMPEGLKSPFGEQSLAQGTNFTLTTDLGNLDLLGEMSGVGGYAQIVGDAKTMNLGGIVCKVASLETVIRSKEAADRPKDRATLPELKALRMLQKQQEKDEGR
jgi:predicted nucleotidyltransferase